MKKFKQQEIAHIERLTTNNHSVKLNRSTFDVGLRFCLKSLIAIIVSLIAWELILSNTVDQSPGNTTHPTLGRIRKSGLVVEGNEGFSRTKINSLGMRNDEINPKSKGEFRVLSLGDSFTSGEHVSDTHTYSALIEADLKRKWSKSNSPITVVNGGRAGASPAYFLYLAQFYNSKIQPNAVIIQINDSDIPSDMLGSITSEFYVIQKGKEFKLSRKKNFRSGNGLSQIIQEKLPQLGFLSSSSIIRVGGRNLQAIFKEQDPKTGNKKKIGETAQSFKAQSFKKNYDNLIEWTVVELKAKYHNLIIVHIPFVTYNNPNEPPSSIEASLKKITAKHNVPFFAMRQDYVNYYHKFYQPAQGFNNTRPGHGHINEIGHKLITKRLVPVLERMRVHAGQ
jgi:GDSL-like Lipase/Acylhydrolase family